MENQLKKAIDIAKKTGDRLIIYDSAKSHPPYVIMSLDEYEKITLAKSDVRGLTEDELLDKINRDIAIWKSEFNNDNTADIASDFRSKGKARNIMDIDYMPRHEAINEAGYGPAKTPKRSNLWKIPSYRKEGAEEVIEEDRQYLEDIDL